MTETVEACPECDSSRITLRKQSDPSERWRCWNCKTTFAEPITREQRFNRGNISTAGQALVEADPETFQIGGRR